MGQNFQNYSQKKFLKTNKNAKEIIVKNIYFYNMTLKFYFQDLINYQKQNRKYVTEFSLILTFNFTFEYLVEMLFFKLELAIYV
jgi:hypothetical protein